MSTIILDLEADRLLAVEASISKGRLRVRRSFNAEISGGDRGDGGPEAIGAWVRARLDEHGFSGKSVIIAAARGEVLVKRLDAPPESLNAAERHEMISLKMSRQASMTSASSVVDYVEYEATDELPGFVVASAMPSESVRARTDMAKAAGLRLEGIRLRTAGVRALLSPLDDPDEPTLVVTPGIGSAELLMLIGGEVVFSRSVSAALPESGASAEEYATKIAVEASRTMVSFRVMAEGGDVRQAVVVAGGETGRAVASALSARLDFSARTLDPATLIDFDEAIATREHPAIAPLAGLLACKPRGIRAHDFANPTAAPDTTAGRRQAVLGGVFGLIVLLGAGFVVGQGAIGRATRARDAAKKAHDEALGKYYESQLVGARLGHLRAWSADEIDWPAHLSGIVSMLPDAESVALGQVSVRLENSVSFEAGKLLNEMDAWRSDGGMVVTVSGVSRDRDYIGRFRAGLLSSGVYTVSSIGPEVENRFGMQISTAVPSPTPTPGTTPAAETDAAEMDAEVPG